MELTRGMTKDQLLGFRIVLADIGIGMTNESAINLIDMLLAEMDKPKSITVTTEKEQNIKCGHFLRDTVCDKYGGFTEKNRELVDLAWKACLSVNGIVVIPAKSPEREIAERRSKVIVSKQMTERELISDQIEYAINEYKESVK